MGTRTVEIHCPKCNQTGAHRSNCQDVNRLPVVCIVLDGGFIESVKLNNGLDFSNKAPRTAKLTFITTECRGFSVGRTLIQGEHSHVWQTYPEAFENTLFQGPLQNSTGVGASVNQSPAGFSGLSTIPGRTPTQWAFGGGQVPGSHEDLDLSVASQAELLTSSLTRSTASNALVQNIPRFDGNPKNFQHWIRKVKAARKYQDDTIFVDQIKQKLGSEPTEYISGQGADITTVDGLLDCLRQQYDLLADPSYSHNAFINLVQGKRELSEYHSDFANLLPAVEATLDSTNPFVSTSYIRGLDDERQREDLNMLIATNRAQGKPTTVKMLMDRTTLKYRVKAISKHKSEEPVHGGPAPVQVAAAQVNHTATSTADDTLVQQATNVALQPPIQQVNSAAPRYNNPNSRFQNNSHSGGGRQQGFRFNRNPGGGQHDRFCPIHKVRSHSLDQCKLRDATQCPYCQVDIQLGTLAAHIPRCQGRRCANCGRLGHTDRWCKYDRQGNYVGVPQQFQDATTAGSRAPRLQGRGGGDADLPYHIPQQQRANPPVVTRPRHQVTNQNQQVASSRGAHPSSTTGHHTPNTRRSRSPRNRPRSPLHSAHGQGRQDNAPQGHQHGAGRGGHASRH